MDRVRQAALAVAPGRRTGAVGEWAVVLDQAFERLPGEVQSIESRITALDRSDNTQRLRVVVEAADRLQAAVERSFSGVAERRVPKIMGERRGLGEVLVETER